MEPKTGLNIYLKGLDVIEENEKSDYDDKTTRERSDFDKRKYVTIDDLQESMDKARKVADDKFMKYVEDGGINSHNDSIDEYLSSRIGFADQRCRRLFITFSKLFASTVYFNKVFIIKADPRTP